MVSLESCQRRADSRIFRRMLITVSQLTQRMTCWGWKQPSRADSAVPIWNMVMQLGIECSNLNCQMIQEWLDGVLISTEPWAKDSACGQPLCPVPLEICSHLLVITLTLNSLSVLTRLCLWVLPILFQSKWDNETVYLKPYKHHCLIFSNPAHFKCTKSQ